MERRNLRKSSSEEESLSLASSGSKSCASSLTIDGSWFQEIRAHKLRIVAFVSRFHETKLKVVRRRHSEVNRSSGHQRAVVLASPEKAAALVASTESGSCLSSGSGAASSSQSHFMNTNGLMMKPAGS
ncbi:hypothetical protein NC653_036177 [Populus alba x Populus x berolinensis]|uniref:Uncharacterized protein n=1 Tax=Populus alba x Populus x berolinensis TaxID=444605 RepID=A0AAD6PVG3_9ROSI|nr:uncharacterized protein LOC118051664 [Populus alba]KAJ6968150.1 hypothetical protein NC653_036177 [Populus alba x Populus x berolinensis]